MSKFNGKRLPKETFALDVNRLRQGYYTDAYFTNTMIILQELSRQGYSFEGSCSLLECDTTKVQNGDIEVEMQFFPRRKPFAVAAGIDEALAMLEECTGFFDEQGNFVNTFAHLEIEAEEDGELVSFGGDSNAVTPVLKVRGRYRDFAELETPILGVLTEGSKVATNVYNIMVATGGKDVLFFPARFAPYTVQPLHGYAYALGVSAYNERHGKNARTFVSTHAQGSYYGGRGGGTISHASIACFLGDTVETMMQFSKIMPLGVPRIALVDFHNDCVGETKKVARTMFDKYWELYSQGREEEAMRYKLFAVRPDTAGNMRDVSVLPIGDKDLDCGVNPRLIHNIRQALDTVHTEWTHLPAEAKGMAEEWCRSVRIVATGGFDVARVTKFESLGVPVDIYGIGSALLDNSRGNTTDYTADIVRVRIDGQWYPLSKVGRKPNENPNLKMVKS